MSTQAKTVLIACDKFKGTLTAVEVAEAIASGVADVRPGVGVERVIIADGGDGTLLALEDAGYERRPVQAAGPTGALVDTYYVTQAEVAVIEMAEICGLVRLPGGRREPLLASSYGVGQVMAAALDAGYRRLVLAVGGSASNDGGVGMLCALGARIFATDGAEITEFPGAQVLGQVARVDLRGLHEGLRGAAVTLACDVDNPLLGERGAVAVYGPQKGVTPEIYAGLEADLAHWAGVLDTATGRDLRLVPGAGAAGGVGYAAMTCFNTVTRPGIELLLDLVDFARLIVGKKLVITGEGHMDSQSLHGKAPVGVALAARAAGVRTVAVCGRYDIDAAAAREVGIEQIYALVDIESDVRVCMTEAGAVLRRLAAKVAEEQL